MSEAEFNEIFSKRLKYFLNKYDITQAELARRLGVSTQSVTNWCRGVKSPRMDKVDAMCEVFHCLRKDLMQEPDETDIYYSNEETRAIAQEIYENPNLRSLFDVAKDIPADRLKAHIEFMKNLKDSEK
ncbi:MAG: helix-turn-helix domain-containing protein [Butyrivibrio sp.]|nr:helix-turn-helix domain-containing protein [Butyrivibrio sp.]